MRDAVVVQPDPHRCRFLERLPGGAPAGIVAERVTFLPESRLVRLLLRAEREPGDDLRRALDAHLRALLPEVESVEIDYRIPPPPSSAPPPASPAGPPTAAPVAAAPSAPPPASSAAPAPPGVASGLTCAGLCAAEADAIRAAVCAKSPAARGWLDAGRFRAEGDLVVLEVIDEVGARSLRDRGAAESIRAFFAERGLQARVMIEVAADPEALRRESEARLERLEAAAPPPPPPKPVGKEGWKPVDGVYLGRRIAEPKITPCAKVTHGVSEVTVEGRSFAVETREVKNGKVMVKFAVSDGTDSVACKLFEKKEKCPVIPEGAWLVVHGRPEVDAFDQETVVVPRDIWEGAPRRRTDDAPVKRVELHAHCQMSALDAITNVKEYVDLAIHFGHEALALTDHGVVQGFPEFYAATFRKEKDPVTGKERKVQKIKPLLGMEGYLADGAEPVDPVAGRKDAGPTWHVVILARDKVGLRHLYELVSLSHLDHFYRKPRIPRAELIARREGLLLGSACEAGEVYQAALSGDDAALDAAAAFYDYLEIQPLANNRFLVNAGKVDGEAGLVELNRRIVECGRRLGKPVVATCDTHFLNPEDSLYRIILQTGQKYADAENQAPLYFRSTSEMLEEFAYLGEETAREVVIESPRRIAALCEDGLAPIPKDVAFPEMEGAEEKIRSMSYERAKELYGDPLPAQVERRLAFELDCIIKNKFATLYLLAHELVKKSNEDGYLVGSRGSVGSSFVATMTRITEVNPLPPHWLCPNPECRRSVFYEGNEIFSGFDLPDRDCPGCGARMGKDGHDIPFATFLGFEGDKTPDIDLNFSGEYQGTIHKYVETLFGSDNVFRAGTISTIQEKTAHGFVNGYLEENGLARRKVEKLRLARSITGVKRTTGQHPGGIIIVPKGRDIHEFTPVNYPANDRKAGTRTTHFEYTVIHDNLLKLDLLGHDDPTFIRLLQDMTGIDVFKIPFNDPETMAIFSSTETLGIPAGSIEGLELGSLGIPEFGTGFVRGMLMDTRPSTFAELVRISGLSHGTDVWLNNAQDVIRRKLAPLKEVISVRDDIMNYLMAKGMPPKESFTIMEMVRKGKGLTPEMEASMRRHRVPEWYIESCHKIKYMFPKAHAVAYVMMAFRIAWFKVHRKEAYYAVYFSTKGTAYSAAVVAGGMKSVRAAMKEIRAKEETKEATQKDLDLLTVLEVVEEAMARGVRFLPVDLYASAATRFRVVDGGILPSLTSIDGLGESAAEKIVAARAEGGPFGSIEDFKKRTGLPKSVVESLKGLGCFGDIPETDQLELF